MDPEWKNPVNENKVHYAGLQPGEYTFKVIAANNDEVFGKNPATFTFKILPPWYKTWWAYFLYAAIVFSIITILYTFNLNRKLALAESVRLKDIDELKNNLFTNITHEFRTPLTVILGMTNHLKSNIEDEKFIDAEKSIEMIERNGQNLLKLISEMLDLAKLENNKTELDLINGDIVPFIKYLSESFHSMADESNIQLTVYTEVDSLFMDYDVNKISAVVYNLISNSIKFSDKIDGKIIVHLNQIIENEKPCLVIKIKDNGVGIAADHLPEIFNKFYQVNASVSRSGEGTGVGLALTKELVTLMMGNIVVKSKLNEGSEFIVTIPITQKAPKNTNAEYTSRSPIVKSTKPPEIESEIFKSVEKPSNLPLILLIEDNKDVAHYLEACLIDKYQTIHTLNGTTGMETAFEKVPDVIICDVMMPGIDGYEVCKRLKSDERTDHIPIIMLTAKVTIKDRITGLSQGADAYLTKPFVKAELFTRLDQLISLRKKMLLKMENGNLSALLHKKSQSPEEKFLKKVVQYIHDEIENHDFGSKNLAIKLNLSESQVYRKLKAISDKSTAVFIRSVRLQKAKELLNNSDKTISEIAYDVGFNDPSWFSRAFKVEFGHSPIEFRK